MMSPIGIPPWQLRSAIASTNETSCVPRHTQSRDDPSLSLYRLAPLTI